MGFFDKLAESAFKESSNGEIIYYPNGALGKGRLVTDPAQKTKLFNYSKRLFKYLFPLGIIYGMGAGFSYGVSLESIIPIIVIYFVAFIRQRFLIKNLAIHNEKLTIKEGVATVSQAYHPVFLASSVINGVLLVCLAFALPSILNKSISEILSLVIFVFMVGVVSIGFGAYFFRAKN